MRIFKFNEMLEKKFDFYKSIYIESEKSVVASYFISYMSESLIEIVNIQENEIKEYTFISGKAPYWIMPHTIKISPSQIEIISDDETKPGYKFIKMPYWLFKRNSGFEIKRLECEKNLTYIKTQINKEFLDKLENTKIRKCFEVTNPKDVNEYERIISLLKSSLKVNT